jgi:hypothetical protein
VLELRVLLVERGARERVSRGARNSVVPLALGFGEPTLETGDGAHLARERRASVAGALGMRC